MSLIWTRKFLCVALLATSALAAGCTEASLANGGITVAGGGGHGVVSVSAHRMAQELNLSVVQSTACYTSLKNSANLVLIYPDPNGRVFVNGRPMSRQGGVFVEQGEMFVPAETEREIRQYLRPVILERRVDSPPVQVDRSPKPLVRLGRGSVLVDPGHGGADPGAQSVLGYWEKVVVLDVGTKMAAELDRAGVKSSMTRNSDVAVDLDERWRIANRQKPDLFVSVHADWAKRVSASGFTLYIAESASAETLAAAGHIEQSMKAAGFGSLGIRRKNFRVVANSSVPAVLIELGYLSNPTEAGILKDPRHRTVYAHAISEGIVNYLRSR